MNKITEKVWGFLIGTLCCSSFGWGQEVSMDAEYRPRGEFRSGYSRPLSKELSPDGLMMQRVRLNADYRSKWVNAKLSIQDSRIFGEANQKGDPTLKDGKSPHAFLYEAWAELVFPQGFSFRIGRQALGYDDQRLISVCNWSNTGNAHDLALLRFRHSGFKADIGYAYNNNQTNPLTSDYDFGNSFYKTMAYFWLFHEFGETGLAVSAIGISEGFQKKEVTKDGIEKYSNLYKYTYGGNISFKLPDFPLNLYATAYGQAGKTKKDVQLNAYLLAFKLNYQPISSLILTAGVDAYSGTDKTESKSRTKTFSGLYGSNHGFNGAMDYWTSTTLPTGGLIDMFFSAQYKVSKKVTLLGYFHSFRLAREMEVSNKKGLGHEIDLDLTYKFCDIATVKAGWSTYLASDLTKVVRGVTGVEVPASDTDTRFAQWAYVSLTITPKLFTYKHK